MAMTSSSDITAFEATPLSSRRLPRNTYEVIAASAQRWPDAPALTFFMSAEAIERVHTWSYSMLLADITRAANMFHALGVTREHPVAFLLPNLPETHLTIWEGRRPASLSRSIRCSSRPMWRNCFAPPARACS